MGGKTHLIKPRSDCCSSPMLPLQGYISVMPSHSCSSSQPIPPIDASRTGGDTPPRLCSSLISCLPRNLQGFSSFCGSIPLTSLGSTSNFEEEDVDIVRGRLTDGWATVNTHSARSKHRWDKHAYSVRREFPINLGWGFGSGTGRDRRSILFGKVPRKAPQKRPPSAEN